MLEKPVEDYLGVEVRKLGGFYIKLPSFFYSGIPDRLLLFPTALAVFVETKRSDKKKARFEPGQPKWLAKLSKLGFIVVVIYDKDEVDKLMKRVAGVISDRQFP